MELMLYDPVDINTIIYDIKSGKRNMITNIDTDLQKAVYNHYLYQLVLLHFISHFNSQKNTKLRRKILLHMSKLSPTKNLSDIGKFIEKEITDPDDINKLKSILTRYVLEHHDKKVVISEISNSYFNFDRVDLENIADKDLKKIREELMRISKKFVHFGEPSHKEVFPNIIAACSYLQGKETTPYCKNKKLLIRKQNLMEIIEILSHDIKNPSKFKWLFNSLFVDRSIEFLKFIKRPAETITIEIE
jgi:hypothetical protein